MWTGIAIAPRRGTGATAASGLEALYRFDGESLDNENLHVHAQSEGNTAVQGGVRYERG